MKRVGLIIFGLVFTTAFAVAQEPAASPAAAQVARTNVAQKPESPTEADMYCSGFISSTPVADNSMIVGGWDTPFQTRFSDRDHVYLRGGSYEKGQRYHILRAVKDVNPYEIYKGQNSNRRSAGTVYKELGRVQVMEVQKGIGIANVEFSCDAFTPGDLAVPFQERPVPAFRRWVPFERYAEPNGKTTGTIIAGNDFDVLSSTGQKVYINVGANQGIKAGDYFRVTRTYDALIHDEADGQSLKADLVEPYMIKPAKLAKAEYKDLPRKSIGEAIVLHTTATTSTLMVRRVLEQVQIGDGVELMDELPPLPPPPPPAMNPPTITCTASPATIKVGETSNIRCAGTSPDERPLSYTFAADSGQVVPRGEMATLDARNARPGVVNVTSTVADDRGLTANAITRINVEQEQAPEANRLGELGFKVNGAYVDNQAKAFLDDVALRLQREAGSNAMLVGFTEEKEAERLGLMRANNAKNYLVRDKGIDAGRINTADGGRGGRKVDVWFVPAGAAMPEMAPSETPKPEPQAPPSQDPQG
jgi:outer membrane protein OmpA-like peptidoglycan-associated protein